MFKKDLAVAQSRIFFVSNIMLPALLTVLSWAIQTNIFRSPHPPRSNATTVCIAPESGAKMHTALVVVLQLLQAPEILHQKLGAKPEDIRHGIDNHRNLQKKNSDSLNFCRVPKRFKFS